MIFYRPDAQSDILRARQIVIVQIESAKAGAWQPISNRLQQRDVDLLLSVIKVMKGELRNTEGERIEAGSNPIQVRIQQAENVGPRFTAVPGAWSEKEFTSGMNFLVFGTADNGLLNDVLRDPLCLRVEVAEMAQSDVELAVLAGMPALPIDQLLTRTRASWGDYGSLFALYLVDRMTEILFSSPKRFSMVLEVATAPELNLAPRWTLLSGAFSQILLRDPAPIEFVSELVSATLSVLDMPETADLHRNLLGTYLPNLLGLEGGCKHWFPDEVFPDSTELERVLFFLEGHPLQESAGLIIEWLRS